MIAKALLSADDRSRLVATLNGTDPDVHADGVYPSQQDTDRGSGGTCRAQQRNGNLLVEVMGCRPNGQELVWQEVLTG